LLEADQAAQELAVEVALGVTEQGLLTLLLKVIK
jgi:hypothetical protein